MTPTSDLSYCRGSNPRMHLYGSAQKSVEGKVFCSHSPLELKTCCSSPDEMSKIYSRRLNNRLGSKFVKENLDRVPP